MPAWVGRDENVCALVGGVNNVKVGVCGLEGEGGGRWGRQAL